MTAINRALSGALLGLGLTLAQAEGLMPSDIETVLKDHRQRLMALPGVIAVGQGECQGQPCIRIFATPPAEALRREMPEMLEGIPIELNISEPIKALD